MIIGKNKIIIILTGYQILLETNCHASFQNDSLLANIILNQKHNNFNNQFDEIKSIMNKKTHAKQYQSSIALYQRLKKVLHAQKNIFIESSQPKSHDQLSISQSLNMNELLINAVSSKIGFSLTDDLERSSITLKNLIIPYQERKSVEKDKILTLSDPKKKKVPYFEVFKGKNHHLLSVKESRQKRMNSFFTPKSNTEEKQQNEQNFAYSLILKTLKQEKSQQKPNKTQSPSKQHSRASSMSCQYQRFFNNSQIHKNIQSIESIKKQLSTSCERDSKMMKHFPQMEILNQNYFTQSKKNLFKRINSNSKFNSFNGNKELIITTKNIDIKNHECRRFSKKEILVEDKKYQDEKRKNFQYFVYEYQTGGDKESKLTDHFGSSPTMCKQYCRTALHSAMFLRSKPSCIHRQEPHSATSADFSQNNMFHNFIYKNKQINSSNNFKSTSQHRQRSMTANLKSRERYDLKYNHSRVSGDGKTIGIKGQVRNVVDDNFVKPWESPAQGEVGF